MIRHRHDNEFFLFTQHEHALLSARLAERIDGSVIARPAPQTLRAIALHDSGWPLHDDAPTLNKDGEPLHVFETPPGVAVRVWAESARIAAGQDAYSGLLVSIHVLGLSMLSLGSHRSPHDVFELNKFQHRQVELQEQLRLRLGLRIDMPLEQGLAPPHTSTAEDALLFDYRLLRATDQLSLALLCRENLFDSMDGIFPRPGAATIRIQVQRPHDFAARLDPWPFAGGSLQLAVPFRRVPARSYSSEFEFRQVYATAKVEAANVHLSH